MLRKQSECYIVLCFLACIRGARWTLNMRVLPWILLLLAVCCWVFSYWGLNTTAGRRAFDEMAGIIPFVAGPIGIILALAAGIMWWWTRRT